MRTAHQAWVGVFAATFVLVAAAQCSGQDNAPTTTTASSVAAPTLPPMAPYSGAPSYPTAAPAAPVGETVTVTRVVDGDTLIVNDNRRVRVLGIDACESSTAGGKQATSYLQTELENPYNRPVTLTRQPGVDRDRFGRELRYVQLAGADLGHDLIAYPEVGVYAGHNDADPGYVAALRAADDGPRNCAGRAPAPVASSDSGPDIDVHHDDDNHRDGALTGGFCSHRRWC